MYAVPIVLRNRTATGLFLDLQRAVRPKEGADYDANISNRLIAFDTPWHGKSLSPEGFETEEYLLTTDAYINAVLAVMGG